MIRKEDIFTLFVLTLRCASTFTADIAFAVIGFYALLGRVQAVRALFLLWLFLHLSPSVAPDSAYAGVARHLVVAAAAASVLVRGGVLTGSLRVRPLTAATLLLGFFFVLHSLLFSRVIDVSVTKSISWTIGATTIMSAWGRFGWRDRKELEDQVFRYLTYVLVASAPLLLMPEGYLVNGNGFQGVLRHPQSFGPAMALLGAWATGKLLVPSRGAWIYAALLGGCMVMILLSEARTAGFSLLIGVAGAFATRRITGDATMPIPLARLYASRRKLVGFIGVIVLAVVGAFFTGPITDYISKRGEADSVAEAYDLSRGGLMRQMWSNITRQPWQGIGFGVASRPEDMHITRDPVLGLPVGASIEKGVMPLAVLEEVGIFGFLMVSTWLAFLLIGSVRSGFGSMAVLLTALALNLGEYTLFSIGGFGMLPMLLMGWAVSARARNRI